MGLQNSALATSRVDPSGDGIRTRKTATIRCRSGDGVNPYREGARGEGDASASQGSEMFWKNEDNPKAPSLNIHIDYSDSQLLPSDDYLYSDAEDPEVLSAYTTNHNIMRIMGLILY